MLNRFQINNFELNGNRIKHSNGRFSSNNFVEPETKFYYNGIYGEDNIKCEKMPGNIRRDFEPFSDFLKRSIDSKKSSVNVGADFRIPENEQNLTCCDSLIKIKSTNYNVFSVSVSNINIYELIFNEELDDDFNIDDIEVIIGRRDVIWSFNNKDFICSCNNSYFLVSNKKIENNKKVNVWLKDENLDSLNAILQFPDYNELLSCDKISISNKSCKINRCEVDINNEKLLFYYEGDIPESVSIFNIQITDIAVEKNNSSSIEFILSDNKNIPYDICKISYDFSNKSSENDVIPGDGWDYYLIKNCNLINNGNNKKRPELKIKNKISDYRVCTKDELYKIINDSSLHYSSGNFSCSTEEEFNGDDIYFGCNKEFAFKKNNTKYGTNFKRRLKDVKGKYVGTIIELIEDDDFNNDVYSNLDILFAESTRELSDSSDQKNKERRHFRIGWTDQNNGLMEIAQISGKHLVKIDFSTLIGKKLYAVADISQLMKQKYSINRLMYKPMPAHKPLLELTERRDYADWGKVKNIKIDTWYKLTDDFYEGCDDQREFVEKALGTPDFAFLDGPPGSGKTTTILELIAQAVVKGQRIMLAASTNAAVDNILERLDSLPVKIQEQILAVRLGNSDRISEKVDKYNVNNIEDNDLRKEIIKRANLVCSTIFGILQHPEFNINDRAQPAIPMYDYLIIDEASKTTFQDFLVPALYAKRWILSGDLRQLTPYTEQEDMEAALRENTVFDLSHQYVQSILMLFKHTNERKIFESIKLCIPLNDNCINAAVDILGTDFSDNPYLTVAVIGKNQESNYKYSYFVNHDDFIAGKDNSFVVFGADILFVEDSIYENIQPRLLNIFVPVFSKEGDYYLNALNKSLKITKMEYGRDSFDQINQLKIKLKNELNDKSWAKEIVWRLCRLQELFLTDDSGKQNKYKEQIEEYISEYNKEEVNDEINLIKSIALPSILQLLKQGVSETVVKNRKETALNKGIPSFQFNQRYSILKYQHRMHPEISKFSRDNFYNVSGENNIALLDPNDMVEKRSWNCNLWKSRSVWHDVSDKYGRSWGSKNENEVDFIFYDVKRFIQWASVNPNPNEENHLWSVALLTYYRGQERLLKSKFKDFFNSQREKSYYSDVDKHIELKIFTIDKFQGQEADVVYISLVKSGQVGVGFMDSPNRLNVALTRAKFQRIIVGNKNYFKKVKVPILKNMAFNIESEN